MAFDGINTGDAHVLFTLPWVAVTGLVVWGLSYLQVTMPTVPNPSIGKVRVAEFSVIRRISAPQIGIFKVSEDYQEKIIPPDLLHRTAVRDWLYSLTAMKLHVVWCNECFACCVFNRNRFDLLLRIFPKGNTTSNLKFDSGRMAKVSDVYVDSGFETRPIEHYVRPLFVVGADKYIGSVFNFERVFGIIESVASGFRGTFGSLGGCRRCVGSLFVDAVGSYHRIQLARIDPSNANSDNENEYFEEELPTTKSFPPRWIWTVIGLALFGWGRWILGFRKSQISERIAICTLIAVFAGVILALWSA